MGLLRFLFITISILWLVRFLFRLVLPLILQRLFNKFQQQPGQNYQQQQPYRNYNQTKSGSVHVDYIPPKDKEAKAADKAGEFIDYEEIK